MKSLELFDPIVLEKEPGERLITVLLKDKESGQVIGKRTIKRALLAKYMQPLSNMHVSAQNGQFVIEF